MSRRCQLALTLVAALAAGYCGAAAGEKNAPTTPTAKLSWRCLDFSAEAVLASATTKVCVEPAKAADLASRWRPSGGPAAPSPEGELLLMTIETDGPLGRKHQDEIFFDPSTLALVQRSRVRLDDKGYRKSYRFQDGAMHMVRTSPATSDEGEGPESGWTKSSTTEVEVPAVEKCRAVSEAALLIYLASHHDWTRPAPELCVFANKNWSRVQPVVEGERVVDRTWREGGQEKRARRAVVIRLDARPLDGEDPVELLSLSGNLRLWVDPESRRLLLIQGKAKYVGDIDVQLVAVE